MCVCVCVRERESVCECVCVWSTCMQAHVFNLSGVTGCSKRNCYSDVKNTCCGVFVQVVARGMAEKGTGGSIVNISSIASKIGLNLHAAYCPSKAALDSLTQVMALELGPKKVRPKTVNGCWVGAAVVVGRLLLLLLFCVCGGGGGGGLCGCGGVLGVGGFVDWSYVWCLF